ncbi:DMT family transporter [Alicyclobacillus pomorum]|uniref:DMT family transporter n=1 Tax=Alicyclobacillus pomorum TaxID=204470 RepID=UPI000403BAF5|nr:DMT family transporter [Alicyclobacillus pomorum]
MPGEVTALLCALCYSLTYIFLHKAQADGETIDDGLLPVLGVSSATLAAALGLHYASSATELHRLSSIGFAPILYCATSALFATFLGRFCLYAAISQLGATRGVVIKSLAPAVTVLVAVLWLGEIPHPRDWLGFALLAGSILLLTLERIRTEDESIVRGVTTRGLALAFAAAGLQGTGHIMRKLAVTSTLPPLFGATLEVVFALLYYTVYLIWSGKFRQYTAFYVKSRSLYLLAAGVASSAAVQLFFTASQTAPVSAVAVLVGLQPVLVVLISSVFFRGLERMTWMTYVYVLCMVVGVSFIVV